MLLTKDDNLITNPNQNVAFAEIKRNDWLHPISWLVNKPHLRAEIDPHEGQ